MDYPIFSVFSVVQAISEYLLSNLMVEKILATCRNLYELENFQKKCLIDGKHPFYSALLLTFFNFCDLNAIKISVVSSNYEIQGLCFDTHLP